MNLPGGIVERDGRVVGVRPLAVFFNRAFWYEALHMFLAAYVVAGFLVAGVYAAGMLRGRRDGYHRLGFLISFTVAAVVMPFQIFVGDLAAREVFDKEPAKFAAIELLPRTSGHVPETLGGVMINGQPRFGIDIPDGASLLAGYRPSTQIRGLDAVPSEFRPPDHLVSLVHLSFDMMVGTGFLLLGLAAWFAFWWWRRREMPTDRWYLRCAAISGLVALASLESGWVVTEVGRQPWTVVGHLLTRDAVQTSGNLWPFFTATLIIYAAVGVIAVLTLRSMSRRWRTAPEQDVGVPYGPAQPADDQPAGTTIRRVTR
jgi:cytochrome d ubiquinol oxidase subunit I